MIWALAREQVRSQRRYIVSAAVVVALAVGTAVYGALLATSLTAASDATNHALVLETDHAAMGLATEGSFDVDIPTGSSREIAAAVAKAQALGTRVGAQATYWSLGIQHIAADGSHGPLAFANAGIGDLDWSRILVDGHAPSAGEIAVSEAYAEEFGIELGDSVPLVSDESPDLSLLSIPMEVAGITRSPVEAAGVSLATLPTLWVSWDDIPLFEQALSNAGVEGLGAAADVVVRWDGESQVLTDLFGPTAVSDGWGDSPINNATPWILLGTVVLVIGAIAMAFAFGRAQAQSRTQWVATARALGAGRRHVILATSAEAGVLAALGFIGGYVLGWLGTAGHLALVRSQVPGAGVASLPSGGAGVVLGALLLAATLALVVAGVPAFWATRVSPTAALKPESDITIAEVGRRVRFLPVAIVWASVGLLAGVGADPAQTDGGPAYSLILLWVFVLLSLVVANETLRWVMPHIGAWLSRRRALTAIVAGDTIRARPRQYSVPALLIALGTAAVFAAGAQAMLREFAVYSQDGYTAEFSVLMDSVWQTWILPASIIVLGAVTVLATVITSATASVTARERSTREALGVTPGQTRSAAGLAHGVTLITGTVIGLVFGSLIAALFSNYLYFAPTGDGVGPLVLVVALARAALVVLGVGVGLATVSSLIVAAVARTPSLTRRVAEAGRVS